MHAEGRGAVIVVDLDGAGVAAELAHLSPNLPRLVVGTAVAPTGEAPPDLDVLLTAGVDAPPPWIPCGDKLQTAVDSLVSAATRSPLAAVTLVQVLRTGEHLDVSAALAIESLAYSMLQGGPEFRRWLAGRPASPLPADDIEPIRLDRHGTELTVTLNRPERRNALNAAMRDALVDALDVAILDTSVSRVHLRGAGTAFCSGGDLTEFGTVPDPVTGHLIRVTRSPAAQLARCADRVVAHVHGPCVGAGAELSSFAGRVLATPDAWFSLPEVAMGLIPGAGGTVGLPRRIGRSRTAFLALTGQRLTATEAQRWGLVDEITSQ